MAYAAKTNRFYQRAFAAAGIVPERLRSLEEFRDRVPIITKRDLLRDQEEHPPYGLRLGVPPARVVQVVLTSGTSGIGQEVHPQTAADVEMGALILTWGCYWIGFRPGDAVVNTFPVATSAGGLWAHRSFTKQRVNLFSLGTLDTRHKLEHARRFRATGLFCTPSYLMRLENVAAEMGLDPRRDLALERILVAGEPYALAWLLERQRRWGAPIFEYYGSVQKTIAWSCERGAAPEGRRGLLHHLPHLTLMETLDPATRRPVEPGDEGEVVITQLRAEAAPLIRFATGDRARLLSHRACPCGRPFDAYECGTVGRYDDMLKIRGTNVWPQATDEVLFGFPEIAEYQGRVFIGEDGREEAALALEFAPGVSGDVRRRILAAAAAAVRDRTGVRMLVEEAKSPLPRGIDDRRKARRWVNLKSGA
jgi:phenylacetate-CoA ligase